jgi:hypothetical protein
MFSTVLVALGRGVGAVAYVVVLLIIELITAMLVYMYLNLYHVPTFGALVRFAKGVLDTIAGQLVYWFPGTANAAYATLIGELGPKSILLLLIGLLSGVVVRFLVRLITRVARRTRGAETAEMTA